MAPKLHRVVVRHLFYTTVYCLALSLKIEAECFHICVVPIQGVERIVILAHSGSCWHLRLCSHQTTDSFVRSIAREFEYLRCFPALLSRSTSLSILLRAQYVSRKLDFSSPCIGHDGAVLLCHPICKKAPFIVCSVNNPTTK